MGVSVDFIRSEQRNQYVLKELNPLVRSGTLATNAKLAHEPAGRHASASGRPAWSHIEPVGEINYNSIQFSGTKRYANNWQARMSYAYSRGRGNVPTGQAEVADSQFLGDLNLDNEYGPTAVDRPHILTLTGSYDVPRTGGLEVERRVPRPQRNAVYTARHDVRQRSQRLDGERVSGGRHLHGRRARRQRAARDSVDGGLQRWPRRRSQSRATRKSICAPAIAFSSAADARSTRSSTSSM